MRRRACSLAFVLQGYLNNDAGTENQGVWEGGGWGFDKANMQAVQPFFAMTWCMFLFVVTRCTTGTFLPAMVVCPCRQQWQLVVELLRCWCQHQHMSRDGRKLT
jgi:hypothetical protein